jgi:hypothetical protein
LALSSNGWKRDPRLRGALKLSGKNDLAFATARKRSFYVTQPMRQATVQPLRALGVVESSGERFNAFRCTKHGEAFIDAACGAFKPYKRSVLDILFLWARGFQEDVTTSSELRKALSPVEPMAEIAREFLRERIIQGTGTGASRRRSALDWVEALRNETQHRIRWNARPTMLDEFHWRDLRSGALFFAARDAAIALLDQIESHIGTTADRRMSLDAALPGTVVEKLISLRECAQAFLGNNYDPSPGGDAARFCRECTEQGNVLLLEKLLLREGHVLKQRGRDILPGVAFRGILVSPSGVARSPEEDGAEDQVKQIIPLPEGISHRIRNLFLLNLDLRNELGNWLTSPTNNDGGE